MTTSSTEAVNGDVSPWAVRGAVAVMCLVWGSTWLVLKDGLAEMPPLGSAGLRFLIAWAVMLPIAPLVARVEGGRRPTWDLVLAMATGNFAISYGLVYWSEEVLPSSLAAILWGVFPLITALVGHVYLPASRIVGFQWLGLVLGFAGVVMLFATDVQAVGDEARFRGALLLLSPTVSAIATAYVKKHGQDVSAALLNRSALLLGGGMLAAAAWAIEGGLPVPASGRAWFSVLYLAGFGTVLTFTLYFWVLRRASAVSLSLIAYVTPAIALLLGTTLGGEPVTGWTFGGLGLVLAGCAAVLRSPRVGSQGESEQPVESLSDSTGC